MEFSMPLQRFMEDEEGPKAFITSNRPMTRAPVLTNLGQKSSYNNDQDDTSPISSQDSVGSSNCQSGSILSRKLSQSSTTSVATSVETTGTVAWEAGHVLPCIFEKEAACFIRFHRDSVDDWYNHSISHYSSRQAAPPTHALCVYCDESFDSSESSVCWWNRMNHIAEHMLNEVDTKKRPDFGVAKDMLEKGCLSQDHYNEYSKMSERPAIKGLRAHDYVPVEQKKKIEAALTAQNRVVVPVSRSEMRQSRIPGKPTKRLVKHDTQAVISC